MDFWITSSLIFWSLLVLLPVLTEGSAVVNLVATDENGKSIDHLPPGTKVNLNCTYNVDPLYLNFYNGTDKNMYVWDFQSGKELIGDGFKQLVKSNGKGDGWLSIKFEVPYCYKDEVIKCTVLDQVADKHENKSIFQIGRFLKPSMINGTSCNGIISVVKQNEKFSITCSVFGVQPEANFTWPDGCTATDPVSKEDTETCFFNQTSTATCIMEVVQNKKELTCSAENGIGNGNCTLQVNTGDGCENGCEDDNTLTIVLSVTIPLIVIGIAVGLAAFFILKKNPKDTAPLADEIDMNTLNNSSGVRNTSGITPAINPACETESMQGAPNDSDDENDQSDHTAKDPSLSTSSQKYQRQHEDVPEYSNIILAHQRIAMQGQDKHPIPVYSTVKKPKAHPCDSSQPPPPYSKQDHMMPVNDSPPDTREQSTTVHPGLQAAMTGQSKPRYLVNPSDKPKPYPRNPSQRPPAYSNQDHMTPLNDGVPGSRQPYQPQYDDVPEYPDMVSSHPELQAAMTGQDKPRFPVYSSDNKPKPYPRNPSHQRPPNT